MISSLGYRINIEKCTSTNVYFYSTINAVNSQHFFECIQSAIANTEAKGDICYAEYDYSPY